MTIAAKENLVVSISSGKGGVGKTLTTIHVATAAARMGKKVLILDGDLGLANVDVVLGLQARYNIHDVLEDRVLLQDIILDGPLGIRVIPSGSGIAQLTNLSYVQRVQLFEKIETFDEDYDFLLIDTGAGISESVLHFNSIADQMVVVTTPEPHAMTDAYAVIKVICEKYSRMKINLLVNLVSSEDEGLKVFHRLAEVTRRFIEIEIGYLGSVPFDPQVQRSVSRRRAGSESSTHTISGQAWASATRVLLQAQTANAHRSGADVWRELIWTQQSAGSTARI